MTRGELPKSVQDRIYAERHGLLGDDLGDSIGRILDLGIADAFSREELEARVRRHRIAQAFAGPYPDSKLRDGEIVLGEDRRGEVVRISLQWLNAHAIQMANSGAGKTNRTHFMVLQIASRVRGSWLFDCGMKREFSKLRALLQRIGIDLLIVPARALRLNPLQCPDDLDPSIWAATTASFLARSLGSPPRATKLLHNYIHRLYEQAGIFNGSKDYPTLLDLHDLACSDRGANAAARQALIDGLDVVLRALGPDVLSYRSGWQAGELARCHINFFLGGLPAAARDLVINTLLFSELTLRVARGLSNVPMDLYVALDEGQSLVSGSAIESTALTEILPQIRGVGVGLDIGIPAGQDLLPIALSCTATKFLGRCGSAADYDLLGRAMGLTHDQLEWAIHNLSPGRFVAQVSEGFWRHPFTITVPLLQMPPISATTHLGSLANLTVVPARSAGAVPLSKSPCGGQATVAAAGGAGVRVGPSISAAVPAAFLLEEREYFFCKALIAWPLKPASEYPAIVGISPKTAIRIRQKLVAAGLIRQRTLDRSTPGRATLLLEPTPAAEAAIQAYERSPGGTP